ncbi:MAG TPA: radical SAM family heme chaperone HemW [Firmicutes bacterium]|nr:radical SAM family heme chaperone HemW [Bacillota bacterium]
MWKCPRKPLWRCCGLSDGLAPEGPVCAGRGRKVQDIALYIHVPFCRQKCYYCDFVSFPYGQEPVQRYLKGLERELELYSRRLAAKRVKTLYFGGGTPSCLSARELAALLALISRYVPAEQIEEGTMECNPGTISREKLRIIKEAGINRISLGVQALQDEHLARLGRIHRTEDVYRSYDLLRREGFHNIGFDLIFALPGQTLAQWEETLKGVLALAPEHISTYNLIFEEGTPFHRWREEGKLVPPPEELDAAMYQLALEMLPAAGYRQYEIANFARRGRECRHNLTYWRNEPYLGLGPGAHSYDGKRSRWANEASLEKYLAALNEGRVPVATREVLSLELERAETVILGLRLCQGLERSRFQKRFQQDLFQVYAGSLEKLARQGLLEVVPRGIRLTKKGLFFANQVFLEFLPA